MMADNKKTMEEIVDNLVKAAIEAADPGRLLAQYLIVDGDVWQLGGRQYSPAPVFLVSVGKAAVSMAKTAAEKLGNWLKAGIVISKAAEVTELPPTLRHFQGSHPVPDERSLAATTAVKNLLSGTTENDLVLCLISGGTSALLTEPVMPLTNWRNLNQALLACGCPINDINTVRQFFDRVKGGGLAGWAAPAACVSLILSDVIGSNLAHIGSGPTVPTLKDSAVVSAILDDFSVWNWLDEETTGLIQTHLQAENQTRPVGSAGNYHTIIGDVSTATTAAAGKTAEWGFNTTIVSNTLTGEARDIGQMAARKAKTLQPNQCLIWGGESTVTLRGSGRGGRNQEIALAAAIELGESAPNCLVLAFSTDGEDGPLPVAGAWVTGETISDARHKGLDPAEFLTNNDSYTFFEQLGWGHLTAKRGTNVNDILISLKIA